MKSKDSLVFIFEDSRLAGPHVYVMNILEGLAGAFDVTVVGSSFNSNKFSTALSQLPVVPEFIPLRHLSRGFISNILYLLFFPFELYVLYRTLRRINPSFVYLSGGCWQAARQRVPQRSGLLPPVVERSRDPGDRSVELNALCK